MFAKHKENEKELNRSGGSLKELSICVTQVLNLIFHYDHRRIEKNVYTPAPRGEIWGEPALVRKGSPAKQSERIFPTINSLKEEKI
jgi:hypothetical protein